MRLLDLFSGIGGFSLGLERSGGFKTVAFCEIDNFCRRVLAKHWPGVPCYDDIRTLSAAQLAADGLAVDAICGGFPCQDVSLAGRRAGLGDTRSGLWAEYSRLVGELRPRIVIVENTPGLLSLGMGRVLGDLAALGYDAEWHCLPAIEVGAEHVRDRVWIIAYPSDAHSHRELQQSGGKQNERRRDCYSPEGVADALPQGFQAGGEERKNGEDAGGIKPRMRSPVRAAQAFPREHWSFEPLLGRGVHGFPIGWTELER